MMNSSLQVDTQPGLPDHQLVGTSASRYAIKFFAPSVGTVIIASSLAQLQLGGMYLAPGQAPLRLCIEEDGAVVQQSWFVRYTAPGEAIAFIEVLG